METYGILRLRVDVLKRNLMLTTFEAKEVKYSLPPICFSYILIFNFPIIIVVE